MVFMFYISKHGCKKFGATHLLFLWTLDLFHRELEMFWSMVWYFTFKILGCSCSTFQNMVVKKLGQPIVHFFEHWTYFAGNLRCFGQCYGISRHWDYWWIYLSQKTKYFQRKSTSGWVHATRVLENYHFPIAKLLGYQDAKEWIQCYVSYKPGRNEKHHKKVMIGVPQVRKHH